MNHTIKVLARVVLVVTLTLYILDIIGGAEAKSVTVKVILVLVIIGFAATALLALGGKGKA